MGDAPFGLILFQGLLRFLLASSVFGLAIWKAVELIAAFFSHLHIFWE